MDQQTRQMSKRRRGVYLLPNLCTTGTLFGGFYAIVSAIQGNYAMACIAVIGAMIADTLDGFVARKTNTSSEFGKEYDSLCDMAAFGLAASLVIYQWSLHFLADYRWLGGKLGWIIAFTYAACAALRLARFNVLASRGEAKGNFFGLPSPGAAAVVIGFVWAADANGLKGEDMVWPAAFITLSCAGLMVSNMRFFSLKTLRLTERVPFRYIVFAVGGAALIFALPIQEFFFLAFFSYALSGPVGAVWRKLRKRTAVQAAP